MINVTTVSLIQELRAIHALTELPVKINIDSSEEPKFELLKHKFSMVFSKELQDGINISDIMIIDHSKPSTAILSVEKPLIFPKAITNYLRKRWPNKRKNRFGFIGLLTFERQCVIEKWLWATTGKSYSLKTETIFFKIKRKLYYKLNIHRPLIKKFGKLSISSSNRGRIFPIKSWDDDYYNFLLKSQFILCPSGVFTWTYRFFESILCGAIPIVEEDSPAYNGFWYFTMEEKLSNIKWSEEMAEFNLKLCLERITFSEKDSSQLLGALAEMRDNSD